jgi:hypothetical protein
MVLKRTSFSLQRVAFHAYRIALNEPSLRKASTDHNGSADEHDLYPGLPTNPSHAPVTASLVAGTAQDPRVPPVDTPPRRQHL